MPISTTSLKRKPKSCRGKTIRRKVFWEKDKSKNLIKQITKLKYIKFYDKLGNL